MSAPYQRRRDPQPVGAGWEIAVAVIGAVLLGLGLAALVGLGVASAVFGGGWVWPHGTHTIEHTIGGLIAGHPGRGLPPLEARRVPGPVATYACVAACELVLITAAGMVGMLIARYRRPGDVRSGMASRREAEHTLGLRQLRAAKAIIRPDRYGPGAKPRPKEDR